METLALVTIIGTKLNPLITKIHRNTVGNATIQNIGGNNVFVIRNLTQYFAQNITIPAGNFTTLRVAYWYR